MNIQSLILPNLEVGVEAVQAGAGTISMVSSARHPSRLLLGMGYRDDVPYIVSDFATSRAI